MTYNLNLAPTKVGYILTDGQLKFVCNKSKYDNSKIPYYLKQVAPNEQYISGLFYDSKHDIYTGKDTNSNKIRLHLGTNSAKLDIW